jgi:hypothetical protein
MWKVAVVTYFKAIFRHSPAEIGGDHLNLMENNKYLDYFPLFNICENSERVTASKSEMRLAFVLDNRSSIPGLGRHFVFATNETLHPHIN